MDSLCFSSAAGLARKIRTRKLGAVEVVQAFLERIQRVDPVVGAYVTLCEEDALAAARAADTAVARGERLGPLHGVPFSVKDLIFTRGVRTTAGSRIHSHHVPREDAVVVARLRAAGAILLGKTNTPEFGYKAVTDNPLFGHTRNPWNLDFTPGGSSGGAAAATAAGLSPLSIGSDGGGSIRIPASCCGVYGLKPTFGLIPSTPGFGGWRSLSHIGPIARSVRDASLMLGVMAGEHEADRLSLPCGPGHRRSQRKSELRIGFSADLGFARVAGPVRSLVEGFLPVVQSLGHGVTEAKLDLSAARSIFETVVLAENAAAHHEHLERHAEIMDPGLVRFVEGGIGLKAEQYIAANDRRDELARKLSGFFERCDLLLTPTLAVAPFELDRLPREIEGTPIDPLGWIPFTYPFNLTGNPAASIPCGWTSDGLPVGLQVVGPRHRDGLVLELSRQLERVRPWARRRPAIA